METGGVTWRTTEYDTYEQAANAAAQEAAATMSTLLPAIMYQQGGRPFLATSFSLPYLCDRVRLDTLKKGEDPDEHINRPLIPEHVRGIVNYLSGEADYILPAITLTVREQLHMHLPRVTSAIRLGIVVLPVSVEFQVSDGQHRIAALRESRRARPSFGNDGIAVTILHENNIDRIHQDFVDCAQVKPIPASLLTAFNQRDPLAKLSREIAEQVHVFKGRIEKVAKTVGKNSINIFTMNQIRIGLAELLTGDSFQASAQLQKAVSERIAAERDFKFHSASILRFFRLFTASNPQWLEVADTGAEPARDRVDIREYRQDYVHFSATGLTIMGRVGFSILKLGEEEQEPFITKLAELDWSRKSPLWTGTILDKDGRMGTSRIPVERAIARVKKTIGLPLTHRDEARLNEPETAHVAQQPEAA